MFEILNSFWGGMVTFAGGLITILTLVRLVSSKPRLIAYDIRSERMSNPNLPADFSVCFCHEGRSFPSIHKAELIIKNETGSPLTDESFLSQPVLKTGSVTVCTARRVHGIDDSRGKIELSGTGELWIGDLMVPIDSSITFEVISVDPIDQSFHCLHKDARCLRRNYASFARLKESLFIIPVASQFLAIVLLGAISAIGAESIVEAYGEAISGSLSYIGLSKSVSGLLLILHPAILSLLGLLLFRLVLRPSAAEVRFSDLKTGWTS